MKKPISTTADEIVCGQKITVQVFPNWSSEIVTGIVVDVQHSYGDPASRVYLTLWSWEGYEDVALWDVDEVTIH